MSQFLYGFIKHLSKLKVRVSSLSNFEKSIFRLIDEIEIYAKTLNYEFKDDDKKMLKQYLVRYCSLTYKTKPDINSNRYIGYRNYLIAERKYYANKPTDNQFINKDAFEKEIGKWENLKPNMNSKVRLQYEKYMKSVSNWKDTIDESQLSEKALKSISKNKRNNVLQIIDIVHKFPNLQYKIFELIKFIEAYSS